MSMVTIINVNDGKLLEVAKGKYRIIVSGKETGGQYAIIEMNVPPGGGPGPHAHNHIEELFYVASGELEFRSESGFHRVGAGATVRIPKGGGVHAFKNISGNEARLICTVYPAGLEEMFEEVSAAVPSEIPQIAKKFGNELLPADYFESRSPD
ncbi:MAG: cupin domain-containing protein [Chitinophagaceae bacterium]|nr:MAG: cupin domain-containing protein [Chitinophagaceae bacterium]